MPQCHNCPEPASWQTSRHLTDAEYAALPENFLPIDGYAVTAVFGCDDCVDAAPKFRGFCTHPEPEPVACPKCKAVGDAPCTMKNGDPRWTPHQARVSAQPQQQPCRHAHRADCKVFTGCQCAADDQPPARPRTRMRAAAPGPEVSGLTIPVNVAQTVLAEAGHAWPSVISARSLLTQDNRPAIGAEVYTFDTDGTLMRDQHGRPVTHDVIVPLPTAGGQPS